MSAKTKNPLPPDDLDPESTEIPEDCSLDRVIVGKNMMRKNKYMGPCPPKGKHRYFFKLYAVDEILPLDSKSRKKNVLKAMKGHIIEQTELIGTYIKQ